MSTSSRRLARSARAAKALSIRSVADWEALYLASFAAENAGYLSMSSSGDAWDLYNLAYAVDAAVSMYEATANSVYIDHAFAYVTNAISTAVVSSSLSGSEFQDGFLGWANHSHPTIGDDGNEYPLFESYCWRYVTNLLVVVRHTPALYDVPAYRSVYDAVLAFTEQHIFDKWTTRGLNAYIYRQNMHMASHWAMIALDVSRLSADLPRTTLATAIYQAIDSAGLPNYSGSLRSQLQTLPDGSYFWNENWGDVTAPGQDVAHGNAVVSYIVHAYSLNSYWTVTDMIAFTKTLDTHIWLSSTNYSEYVDGTGAGTGWFNDGFCKLGRFSVALQRRLEQHTVGQNIQLYGNGARNARCLLG